MATALRRERTSGSALGDSDAVPKGRDLATTHLLIWQAGTAEQLGSLSIMVACLKVPRHQTLQPASRRKGSHT